jgi:hypothetical protein
LQRTGEVEEKRRSSNWGNKGKLARIVLRGELALSEERRCSMRSVIMSADGVCGWDEMGELRQQNDTSREPSGPRACSALVNTWAVKDSSGM